MVLNSSRFSVWHSIINMLSYTESVPSKEEKKMARALIVVDVQNDFANPRGSLYVGIMETAGIKIVTSQEVLTGRPNETDR